LQDDAFHPTSVQQVEIFPELHLIECPRLAAMRRVEERSLSSILRSKLLTTLINDDVSGKVNARGLSEGFGQFDVMQMYFASGSAEKGPV
jgi:hypothetical protein